MRATHTPHARVIGEPDRTTAELLDVNATARIISASPRSVYRLSQTGRMPAGIRVGGLRRWRAKEIENWIANGCPPVKAEGSAESC
jgi:predicted DNA-binding transcriptional regulator AlpA